jgi:hypothetical protein
MRLLYRTNFPRGARWQSSRSWFDLLGFRPGHSSGSPRVLLSSAHARERRCPLSPSIGSRVARSFRYPTGILPDATKFLLWCTDVMILHSNFPASYSGRLG